MLGLLAPCGLLKIRFLGSGPHLCDEEGLQATLELGQQQGDIVIHLFPKIIIGQEKAQHGP